jgi:hypothetical protein
MAVISNVAGGLLVDILSYARIEPQVLQVELHIFDPRTFDEAYQNTWYRCDRLFVIWSTKLLGVGFKGNVKSLFLLSRLLKPMRRACHSS